MCCWGPGSTWHEQWAAGGGGGGGGMRVGGPGGEVRALGRLAADWAAGRVPSPNKIDGSGAGHAGAALPR